MPSDLVQQQDGHWFRRLPATTHIYTGSRGQLEELVRRRVLASASISVVEETEVVGLHGDARQVRGVLLRDRSDGAGGTEEVLEADLVVDASGAGAKARNG